MKRTEGNWTLEKDGITLVMSGQCVATAIAPDGAGIDEQRGNAALIAAAPRMLAALQSVIEWSEDDHAMPDSPSARLEFYARRELMIRNAARAAIQQATGSAS